MKLQKPSLGIVLAALAGFAAGALSFHVSAANAGTTRANGGFVRVIEVDASFMTSGKVLVGNVVGFSCVPTSRENAPQCYIVTQ
ncbi:MAG: hypothetical protein ACRD5M_09450 [Candidatus Acidiferrales bacterium]